MVGIIYKLHFGIKYIKSVITYVITLFLAFVLDNSDMAANRQIDEVLEKKKDKIKKIETILNDINETAKKGNTPKLYLRNQSLWSNCIYDLDRWG